MSPLFIVALLFLSYSCPDLLVRCIPLVLNWFTGLVTLFVNFVFKGNHQKLSKFQISCKIPFTCRIIRP